MGRTVGGKAKKILVAGAVGKVGGAAVFHLLAYGHRVRIMTHDAREVKPVGGRNVQVIEGDVRNRDDMKMALSGAEGALLLTPSTDGPKEEVTRGKAMIDACAEKEIGHVVYSSVCCANKKTGVPQFDAKYEIEEHLKESGLSHTILRPVWFMEHFASSWYRPSIEKGVLATPLRPDRELQMVSVDDVGRIVSEILTKPSKFTGKEIDIAADRLAMAEIAEEISRVRSKPVRYERISGDRVADTVGKNWAAMFGWLDKHGYDADLWLTANRFKRFEISLTSFREYLDRSGLRIEKAA